MGLSPVLLLKDLRITLLLELVSLEIVFGQFLKKKRKPAGVRSIPLGRQQKEQGTRYEVGVL